MTRNKPRLSPVALRRVMEALCDPEKPLSELEMEVLPHNTRWWEEFLRGAGVTPTPFLHPRTVFAPTTIDWETDLTEREGGVWEDLFANPPKVAEQESLDIKGMAARCLNPDKYPTLAIKKQGIVQCLNNEIKAALGICTMNSCPRPAGEGSRRCDPCRALTRKRR